MLVAPLRRVRPHASHTGRAARSPVQCHRVTDVAGEVIVGAFTLGGVAVGAGLAYLADQRLWKRSQSLAARVLLADTYAHLWTERGYTAAMIHLERLRAHLDMLGVSTERTQALVNAVRVCRGEIARQLEMGEFDEEYGPGLTAEFLDPYRAAVDAIVADLK